MLGQRRTAFNPIPIIAVQDIVKPADLRGMNMAADDAINTAAPRLGHHRLLIVADVFDSVLDLVLEVGGQRPIRETKPPPHNVEGCIDSKRVIVGVIADKGQPLGVFYNAVKLIPVQDEKALAIGHDVDRLAQHRDPAEAVGGKGAEIFVVISWNIYNAGSLSRLA